MSKRCVLSLVVLCLAIVGTSLAKKTPKKGFHFVQPQYAKAITERHRTNATVMHLRAIGAKGQVSYTIMDPTTPFEVDPRGHVWLMKKLNGNKKNIYQLKVKATDSANPNKPIYAEVRFDIMVKNHPPQFDSSDNKYICAVTENSRQVQILPPIRIVDQDKGTLGKLKRIKVIPEEGIPFKFVVNKDGGVEVKATRDLDAEKENMFLFNIVAVDGGEKESHKADVFCKVVDANEFSPEFESSVYIGEVQRGKVYPNILKVYAADKDIGDEYGKICKYDIITKDVPFSINDDGILHLEKPLDKNAPEYCTFQVEAVDCGGKRSAVPTNITVYIKDTCKIELKKPAFEDIIIPQCVGQALVGPDVSFVHNKQCEKEMDLSFSATVHLETNAGLGCDRQKYDASSLYKMCGSSDFIDILPTPTDGKTWTSHLKKDGDAFIFDDKTTPVGVPKEAIPGDFGDHFTVSTWIKAQHQSGKQVIMANTDKQAHNRIHFAFIKSRRYFTVVHRLEPGRGSVDDYCNSDFHYEPHMFDDKWHHLAVVVDGCSVKLYVDGQHQSAKTVDYNYRMHKSSISAGLYVGAHWLGRERAFTQYFKGKLAGMAIKLNKPVSQQAIRCMVGCREHINLNVSLPIGFRSELVGFNKMKIHGVGKPKDFERVLQNIVYQNELFTPTEGKKKVRVTVAEKKTKLNEEFLVNVHMRKNDRPIITVRGCQDEKVKKNRLREMGVPLCSNLKIDYQGCTDEMNSPVNTVKFLDMAVIKVTPPFKKGESLKLPKQKGSKRSIVDDVELESHSDENGLTICGAANYKLYEQLLRDVVYENLNPNDKLHHVFSIQVSDQNSRYLSDIEKLNLSVLIEKPISFWLDREKAINLSKNRPFDLQVDSLSAEELPGAVTVEKVAVKNTISTGLLAAIVVCTVSVFVFLIVLGIYRLRRNANVLEVETTAGEKEEMYWDDTGLGGVRITVNPLQKFQELDLNEDKESENNSDDEDNQEAKQSLEWDEGAL